MGAILRVAPAGNGAVAFRQHYNTMSYPKIYLWAKFGPNWSKNGKVIAFLLFLEVPPEGLPEGHFRSSDRRKISHTRF